MRGRAVFWVVFGVAAAIPALAGCVFALWLYVLSGPGAPAPWEEAFEARLSVGDCAGVARLLDIVRQANFAAAAPFYVHLDEARLCQDAIDLPPGEMEIMRDQAEGSGKAMRDVLERFTPWDQMAIEARTFVAERPLAPLVAETVLWVNCVRPFDRAGRMNHAPLWREIDGADSAQAREWDAWFADCGARTRGHGWALVEAGGDATALAWATAWQRAAYRFNHVYFGEQLRLYRDYTLTQLRLCDAIAAAGGDESVCSRRLIYRHLEDAATLGDGEAARVLGERILRADGVQRMPRIALFWLLRARERGAPVPHDLLDEARAQVTPDEAAEAEQRARGGWLPDPRTESITDLERPSAAGER